MTARLPAFVWLTVFWMLLWGDATIANLVGGVLAAAAVFAVFPTAWPKPAQHRIRILPTLRFVGYFVYKLVEANLVVAWEVVRGGSRINQGIVRVPLRCSRDVVVTSVANAISLTPGTLTLEVRRDPATLWVHVLHIRSIDQTRADIRRLEDYILAAFAPEVLAAEAGEHAA